MAICLRCGHEMADGANFCEKCGAPNSGQEHRINFDGEIHKCPNCGELINSFTIYCPSCGIELRGTEAARSVQVLSDKLDSATTVEEKASVIRNFPIPNTKEDITELMVLASTNVLGEYNRELFNAWFAKFEQCYHKAQLSFNSDENFTKIQSIYESTNQQLNKERAAHGAERIKKTTSKITTAIPNPIFGIAVVFTLVFLILKIISGNLVAFDIILAVVILYFTYKISNRSHTEKQKTDQNTKGSNDNSFDNTDDITKNTRFEPDQWIRIKEIELLEKQQDSEKRKKSLETIQILGIMGLLVLSYIILYFYF